MIKERGRERERGERRECRWVIDITGWGGVTTVATTAYVRGGISSGLVSSESRHIGIFNLIFVCFCFVLHLQKHFWSLPHPESETATRMSNIVRQSKFRHVFCKPVKHEQCMSDVRITEITWDSLFCACNSKFIAIICKGAGGPFLVIPINKVIHSFIKSITLSFSIPYSHYCPFLLFFLCIDEER